MIKKETVYFQNLDALRGVAALAVLLYHCTLWLPHSSLSFVDKLIGFNGEGGFLGVVFFFILSGFLITYLILDEYSRKGCFSISKFYMRRLLRIWPLYFATLIVGFIIYPMLFQWKGWMIEEKASDLLYTTFFANFDVIANGAPTVGILGVHWSVAIEEQFYLFWPLIFVSKGLGKKLLIILIAICIFSWCFSIGQSNWSVLYYHTFSNLKFLVFGAIMAFVAFFNGTELKIVLEKVSSYLNLIIYVLFLSLLFCLSPLKNVSLNTILVHLISTLFFGYIILEQVFSSTSFFKIGSLGLLNYVGKISYGIYLLHMIVIYLFLNVFPGDQYYLLKLVGVIFTTIALSKFSYTYFESYFLKFKNQFKP